MNTAADIFCYAQTHDINLIAEDGQLKIDAPETALTDEFLESAKEHKQEILKALTKVDPELMALVSDACKGFAITPYQFLALTTKEDCEFILSGDLPIEMLRAYAKNFAEGIQTGRIIFHPNFNHGIPSTSIIRGKLITTTSNGEDK